MPEERPRCTAHSKRTGKPCQRYPVDVPGATVCYYHGGAKLLPGRKHGGGPVGNKHRVTTGRRETIIWDTLTDAERESWGEISTDPEAQLLVEIRLTEIREARMMQRIADLAGVGFTEVERTHQRGMSAEGAVDLTTVKSAAALGQIQAIEADLTRVQARKAKLIELAFAKLQAGEDGALAALIDSIQRAREARG